jgi:hypothetical protein
VINNHLTEEEQLLCDLAIEYHVKRGHIFEGFYVASYAISATQQACLYMVTGRVKSVSCTSCKACHAGIEMMLFLRIGRGFTQLELGDIHPFNECDDAHSLLARMFGVFDE